MGREVFSSREVKFDAVTKEHADKFAQQLETLAALIRRDVPREIRLERENDGEVFHDLGAVHQPRLSRVLIELRW